MKKFLFLSMLISAVSGFAAAPVPMVAPASAPFYDLPEAQIFHLCKEALERVADENGKSYLSQEEIEDVLRKAMLVIAQHTNKVRFEQSVKNGSYLYNDRNKKSHLCQAVVNVVVSSLGSITVMDVVLKRFKPGIVGQSLLILGAFGVPFISLIKFPVQYLPLTMIEKYRIEKELQKAKAESVVILDPEKFRYWPFFEGNLEYKMSLQQLSRLFFCDFDNLPENEQSVAKKMLKSLQKLYPTKYLDIDSLRLNSSRQKMQALQALVADPTNSDGTKRRCNVVLAQTMYQLLAASGE